MMLSLRRAELLANALSAQATAWQCDHCPSVYKQRKDVLRHQRAKHGGQTYQCNICMANYSRLDSLARHVKSHASKRPVEDSDENQPPSKQARRDHGDDPIQSSR